MRRRAVCCVATALAATHCAVYGAAHAATATTSFQIQLTIEAHCLIKQRVDAELRDAYADTITVTVTY